MYLIENMVEGKYGRKTWCAPSNIIFIRFATKLSIRINTNIKEIIVSGFAIELYF